MDKEKYLIFGSKLTSEDVDNSDLTVETTTSLVDPVSLLNATSGTDGIIEVQLKAHSDHTWGSAYGTVDAGTYYTINSSGYTVHASSGVVTIIAASSDGVNGVTVSSTANNNDFRFNLLQHIDGGTLACFPMSKFKGMQLVNDTTTDLYFEAGTGDVDAVDVVLVTHGAGKFKQLVEMVNDAMSSNGPSVVNFFIGGNGGATGTSIDAVAFNGNPAAITDVTIQLDT
tara:strand:+ start:737 stop:1417 length:681 start_codon:yes stop_codon:yes gene_type:complete